MTDAPTVGRIFIHPIKSLDPIGVPEAVVLCSGALRHDREFALFDDEGKWINGKRDWRVHWIRSDFDMTQYTVTLKSVRDSQPQTFHLLEHQRSLHEWFSEFFGFRLHLRRNFETGFPDDLESPGPTIISSATLREVGSWFKIDQNETRRRFRANIEIETSVPFWEDRLYKDPGQVAEFRIGKVSVHGVNPCQRCIVPSRHSTTGVATDNFQRVFAAKRAATLPPWAAASRFNHYYRLSVNTRIPALEAGKTIRVGDVVG